MTERISHGLERWSSGIMVFSAVGTVFCFAALVALQIQVSHKANRGDLARDVQLKKQPAGCKIAQDAFRRGVISMTELAPYYAPPNPCPKP